MTAERLDGSKREQDYIGKKSVLKIMYSQGNFHLPNLNTDKSIANRILIFHLGALYQMDIPSNSNKAAPLKELNRGRHVKHTQLSNFSLLSILKRVILYEL